MSPLADLMAMAADNMAAEDPSTSIGRTQAHEAVRVADQTAQIALIGGIVSNLNRINVASAEAHDADYGSALRTTTPPPDRASGRLPRPVRR